MKFTKEQKTFVKVFLSFLLISVIFRFIFFLAFTEADTSLLSNRNLLKAWYIGLKFDARFSLIASLSFWFFGYALKFVNYSFKDQDKSIFVNDKKHPTKALAFIYSILICLYTVFLIFDLGHFDYLQNRIDASALIFLKNPLISFQMITESYPVYLVVSGLIILLFSSYVILRKYVFNQPIFFTTEGFIQTNWKAFVFLLITSALIGHAKLSQYPLRWSEAYFTNSSYISSLALNPALYLYDTLDFKDERYDLKKVKQTYSLMADYLGVPKEEQDIEKLNFNRQIQSFNAFDEKPNIVIIMMESLAAFKMSHFGQKMNGTPFLDEFVKKGLFFDNFYVTSTGTARSIFGALTGLPDVNSVDTASRNPMIVEQYSAVNGLKDYEKSYFIGGSANWGNIRGFVGKSIEGVTIYEEADFKAGKNDVWGISDLKLFKEANEFLKKKTKDKKQFLFIQTAGYHRPYTIPRDKGDFKVQELSQKDVDENGFENSDEYNSLRFFDYALGEFFKAAEKEDYFKNTLFVLYSDHGKSHFASKSVPGGFKRFRLPIMHVPLLFYSPSLKIEPQVISKTAYQPDIMPSVLSLTDHSYVNKTLGRNLFDPKFDDSRFAFTITRFANPLTTRIHNETYISEGNPGKLKGLYPYKDTKDFGKDLNAEDKQEDLDYRSKLSDGIYHTTKYLYYHSKDK